MLSPKEMRATAAFEKERSNSTNPAPTKPSFLDLIVIPTESQLSIYGLFSDTIRPNRQISFYHILAVPQHSVKLLTHD